MNCPNCNNLSPDSAAFCDRCGGQLTADNSLKPGDEIGGGRYRIDSLLGEGGMGTVYKATDLTLERTVALKTLHPELTAHPTARRRMEQEARILASIEHPNVVQVRNVFEEGDVLAMELEFMPGGDLLGAIPAGGMPETEALTIMAAVLDGLHELHEAGLVHRDVKPDNVLMSAKGTPKITDLGVAHDPSAREKTRVGATLGTPEYMAPEQIQGQSLDRRADIYAAGIVLYRMLTADLPFSATTDFEWQAAHMQQEPRLEVLRGRASEPVISIVAKALAKKPADRWSSADQMSAALAGAEFGEGAEPARPGETTGAGTPTATAAAPHSDAPPSIPSDVPVAAPAASSSKPKSKAAVWAVASVAAVAIVVAVVVGTSTGSGAAEPTESPSPESAAISASIADCWDAVREEEKRAGCERACDWGVADACHNLGNMHSHGRGGLQKDRTAAVRRWQEACAGGIAEGCTNLGRSYLDGFGTEPPNPVKGAEFFEKGCDGGDINGCASLGTLYFYGKGGLPRDEAKAVQLFRRACDADIAGHCSNLALMYRWGSGGLRVDEEQARRLFKKACDLGNESACSNF